MSRFSFQELLDATGGVSVSPRRPFDRAPVSTDTRTIAPGDFFLPLAGERFDGHDYLTRAMEAGAIGAFVQRDKFEAHPDWQALPNLIAVPDPVQAYLDVARFYRRQRDPLVVAVTGSSGKTTTKEMLAAALSEVRTTRKTEKNYNNEIGVSQTLLSITPDTELLVVEMGMRGLRQIAPLSRAAEPDVALITNIGPAHIEMLGSLENIARAKLEIAEGLDPQAGVLVINGDDPLLTRLAPTLWPGQRLAYHLAEAEDVAPWTDAEGQAGIRFRYRGEAVSLCLPGEHMVANALGVFKVGEALGFSPAQLAPGLSRFRTEKGRWERQPLPGFENAWVINDAYNANPDSARASLKAFLQTRQPGQHAVLVLGGMKELGPFSRDYHQELGAWLGQQEGIGALYTVGEEGRWLAEAARRQAPFEVLAEDTVEAVIAQLVRRPLDHTVLYLKGSRAYGLETIPEALTRSKETIG